MLKTKRADELEEGDTVLQSLSSIDRTAAGYVMFYQSTGPYAGNGKLTVVPPDTLFTVAST